MAFTLEVIRGATTYAISSPYSLEDAEGMGGASVRNIEESGPYQDGATHLDERLDPRTITLKLNVVGATPSTLDGYRDTLMTIFKPVRGVAITLKVTRDDGSVRQIDTRRTGPLDIPLVAINRPGNLHRAVVQLRAADPVWYDPTEVDVALIPESSDWWLAYATIGTANVLEHVTSPAAEQLWANTVGVAQNSPWTIFIRSDYVVGTALFAGNPIDTYAFYARTGANQGLGFLAGTGFTTNGYLAENSSSDVDAAIMTAGTQNYFFVTNGNNLAVYRGTVLAGSASTGGSDPIPTAAAGTARWRSFHDTTAIAEDWPVALPYAAVYNVALTATQRNHLEQAVSGTVSFTKPVAYAGDFDSYPVITITGYVADPIITNVTTGDALDFTGGTVGSTDVWTIDTRYGRKSVLNAAGSSVLQYLSSDSDLTTFRLVPSPLATGGTNTISVAGSVSGTVSAISVAYFARYLSF